MVTAFTDIVSLVVVMGVMIWLNTLGLRTKIGTFHVIAGLLGVFATGWTFNNGAVTYQCVYSAGFVCQSVDANILVVVLALMTITSFLFIYFDRSGVLG